MPERSVVGDADDDEEREVTKLTMNHDFQGWKNPATLFSPYHLDRLKKQKIRNLLEEIHILQLFLD